MLLIGDLALFAVALWLTLYLRYFQEPSRELFMLHIVPFSGLFVLWIFVFFLAGLYDNHTPIFRRRLTPTILWTQAINVALAGLFFFFVPIFGIAPKTNLLLYLLVSSPLIFIWRIGIFPRLRSARRAKGVLIASGPDAKSLAEEVERDPRYAFLFTSVIDTRDVPPHEVIQRACRVAEDPSVSFVAVDFSDAAASAAMPIIYDAAFHKKHFALLDVAELYQEIFDRVPLSLMRYAWVLERLGSSRSYDWLKRGIDITGGILIGIPALMLFPFIMLAIKMDDGGPVFIEQERVGRFQKPIRMKKFRSMSGNDSGNYGASGTTNLTVTRVGKWLRILRLDELPQLWSIVRGDLSLVGPRPELPALAAQYSARIPYYNARYLVAPGLTGWAQIRHDRHPHHGAAIEETKEKLSYDLFYLRRRSLLMDLYILFQTARIVFTAKGS